MASNKSLEFKVNPSGSVTITIKEHDGRRRGKSWKGAVVAHSQHTVTRAEFKKALTNANLVVTGVDISAG